MSIMLLNLRKSFYKPKPTHIVRSIFAVIFCMVLFLALVTTIPSGAEVSPTGKKGEITAAVIESQGSFQLFSKSLFSEYLLPFELISVIFVACLVGAIAIAATKRNGA